LRQVLLAFYHRKWKNGEIPALIKIIDTAAGLNAKVGRTIEDTIRVSLPQIGPVSPYFVDLAAFSLGIHEKQVCKCSTLAKLILQNKLPDGKITNYFIRERTEMNEYYQTVGNLCISNYPKLCRKA